MVSVVYDGCPRNFAEGMWWPRTLFGQEAIESCPSGSQGKASRLCDTLLGTWMAPDIFNCTSDSYMDLRRLVSIFNIFIKKLIFNPRLYNIDSS